MIEEFIRVPYGASVHGEEEIQAVVDVLRTSTQMGDRVRSMENKVAGLFAKKHGIMVNSGSSANYLAVEILKLAEGSEVITPALTFSTTVAPLIKNKLIPVFIDVQPGTYNINVDLIEENISEKTKLLMIPNLLGNVADWKKIRQLADKHNLFIIEDSADTLGAKIGHQSTGSYSDISTTSFYGSHVINCAGNGGMLCVNDPQLARKAVLLRSWGRSSSLFADSESVENRFNVQLENIDYDAKFIFEEIGYNFEPSEMGAAYGLVQLQKLQKNIELRNKWFNQHMRFFKNYNDWFILPQQAGDISTGWLAFALTIKESAPFSRKELQIFLEKRNIQTRAIFTGNILRQPGFANIPHRAVPEGYPEADRVMAGGVLLGCHHGMNYNMIEHIHNSFELFAQQYNK